MNEERENQPMPFGQIAAKVLGRLTPVPDPDPDELLRQEAAKEAESERKEAWERRRRLVSVFGIPAKEADRIAADVVDDSKAMGAAKAFRDERSKHILVLAGPTGTGKTVAASWLVAKGPPMEYQWGEYGRRPSWPTELHPRFITATELATISLYDRDVQKPLKSCSVLAIDDLGMEFNDGKGAFQSLLDTVLDARYRGLTWTVITTNLPVEDFTKRYGARVYDRIYESGVWCTLLEKVRRPH